ncbi:MAG: HAMP domain-containing protein [Desulfobacteraceae bacterium]|nr:HAMP domain-containing protein [Desulfobacteraceae bacterium]
MKNVKQWGPAIIQWLSASRIGSSFRAKILVSILGLSLIPLVALGFISFSSSSGALTKQAAEKLEAVRTIKGEEIQSWFGERKKDILILSENPSAIDAMLELEEGYEDLGETASERVRELYLGKPDIAESDDGSTYSEAHEEVHELFVESLEYYSFSEIYMITLEGDVVYSTRKTDEFGTNLMEGPYKNTNMADAFRTAIESGDDDFVTITDYAHFSPVNGPAAFIASPMFSEYFEKEAEMVGSDDDDNDEGFDDDDDGEEEGQIVGIMIYQLPISTLNGIMRQRTGLGVSGETYLIGPDKLWRSESQYNKTMGVATSILNLKARVDNDAVRGALGGQSGTRILNNYLGVPVLSSWTPLVVNESDEGVGQTVTWALISEVAVDEIHQPVNRLAWSTGLIVAATALVVILAAFFLSGGVNRQVRNITDMFSEIGIGNFDARAEIISRDEIGRMAEALNAMLDNTLTLIQSREERDAIQASIMKLLGEISTLTDGDLTARAEVTEEVTGAIADSFNAMAIQLSQIVRDVQTATNQVGQTAGRVTSTTELLAENSQVQSKEVTRAVEVINRMAGSIKQVAKRAMNSAKVSEESIRNSKEGAEMVQKTNQAMNMIRERVQETARAIKRLGESSQEIGNIVQIIDEIADRTSILALNASIQAAMAGDAGRGFAVVAEEVQRLAERSTNSTKQIEKLVKNIQGDINDAGTSMEESIQQVVDGSMLADDAYKKLEEIESVSAQLAEQVNAITLMTQKQTNASETVAKLMGKVGEVSTQTSQSSRETAAAMQELTQTAEGLRLSVGKFKLSQDPIQEETVKI